MTPQKAAQHVLELLAEGEEITSALVEAARASAVAEHNWKMAEAKGIARSDGSSAGDRKADALLMFSAVHGEFLQAKAYHEALTERSRWLRSAVAAAQTVLAWERTQFEQAGFGDHVNEGRTRRR